MRYSWLKEIIATVWQDEKQNSYTSLVEEALKLAYLASNSDCPLVVVKDSPFRATNLGQLLSCLLEKEEVVVYTPEESLRVEAIASSYENRATSLNGLYHILTSKYKIIVTSPLSLLRHLPSKETLNKYILNLQQDEEIERESIIKILKESGYEKCSHIEKPLTYAARGSILDIYPFNVDNPIRLEFLGDTLISLRYFSLVSQKTIKVISKVSIPFAKDVFYTEQEVAFLTKELNNASGSVSLDLKYLQEKLFIPKLYIYNAYFKRKHLLDYLPKYQLILSDEMAIERHLLFCNEDNASFITEAIEAQEMPNNFNLFGDFTSLVKTKPYRHFAPFLEEAYFEEINLKGETLKEKLNSLLESEAEKIYLLLNDKNFNSCFKCLPQLKKDKRFIFKKDSDISQGFFVKKTKILVVGANDLAINSYDSNLHSSSFAKAQILESYDDLNEGDYIVHDQYGIGKYCGIVQKEVNGIKQDYLHIVYADNDVLLVPIKQFSLVRKYVSKEGSVPRLHKIGSSSWRKTKEKVANDVQELAKKLVASFALREKRSGHAFSKDTNLQKEFEDSFTYPLTCDQKKAIIEIKKDMESAKPMDRLLCGDVGFGKTEVALRAAFKAVVDHKQVAYLCPTTILSLQHFQTFLKRLSPYPINLALLNRFTPYSEQKAIITALKEGKMDIVIGTHRLLSADLSFKDLGLLIIDEEQRFGVEHKEKIKAYKKTVDFLSLSATPIPRTLQMSLIGIYGLSTLDTPPLDRYPIQTYVVTKNKALINEVILRELQRGGQVFYLHNDIEGMYKLAQEVKNNIPEARIAIAHGQMNKDKLEQVMLDFYKGKTNVLFCTTIIETGIDIPNANTILVENAHLFGLAQLYQIKGRVGRSNRIAYAYLLVPPKKILSEKSIKRLEAIKEFTALGSGYKIAMRDLAIRGAGDLLGDKQSGFIDNVGLDLYLSMLNSAIKKERGLLKEEEGEKVNLQIPLSSYIPKTFTDSDYDKLSIYHDLDKINSLSTLRVYKQKLNDEYGTLPNEVRALFTKKRLEILVAKKEIDNVKVLGSFFTIILSKEISNKIDGYKLFACCHQLSKDIKIRYTKERLELMCLNDEQQVKQLLILIDNLKDLFKDEN